MLIMYQRYSLPRTGSATPLSNARHLAMLLRAKYSRFRKACDFAIEVFEEALAMRRHAHRFRYPIIEE